MQQLNDFQHRGIMSNFHENLKALGNSKQANEQVYGEAIEGKAVLERFPNPGMELTMNPNSVLLSLNITTDEFTSLCPMTGQPDFAKIIIDYVPYQWCVESKALKLYFLSYRNRRDFHESCIVSICNDLVALLEPYSIKVQGQFTARGGIPFWPTCEWKHSNFHA